MKRRDFLAIVLVACTLVLLASTLFLPVQAIDPPDVVCKSLCGGTECNRQHKPGGVTCSCDSGLNWCTISCSDGWYQHVEGSC